LPREEARGLAFAPQKREGPMPFVNIQLVREVIADDPERKKAAIARKVTAAIAETTGLSADAVWVVFEEVAAKDWYVAATSVEETRKAKRAAAS
jgi:4-oxalocrotonate tautomerase